MIPWLGTPVFDGFLGTLDMTGQATAAFDANGALPPETVGLTFSFAYVLTTDWRLASNPVSIAIVP